MMVLRRGDTGFEPPVAQYEGMEPWAYGAFIPGKLLYDLEHRYL